MLSLKAYWIWEDAVSLDTSEVYFLIKDFSISYYSVGNKAMQVGPDGKENRQVNIHLITGEQIQIAVGEGMYDSFMGDLDTLLLGVEPELIGEHSEYG